VIELTITHIDASDLNITSVDFSNLADLVYLDLFNNSLISSEVDEVIIQNAANGLTSGFIKMSGAGNANRTASSDASLEQLVDDGNEIWVNQSNTGTTILGVDDASTSNFAGIWIQASLFTCSSDCYPNQFAVYPNGSGSIKCAVYTDVSSSPGVLLSANNTGAYVSGTHYTSVSMPSYELENGIDYWLVGVGSANIVCGQIVSASEIKYHAIPDTYENFVFPSSYVGEGFSSSAGKNNCFRVRI
jgi:hypothetical protein